MITFNRKLMVISCGIVLLAGFSGTGFCEDNARQAAVTGSSGGTSANTIIIDTDNTITGDITAEKDSTVSVGDIEISNTKANTIDITSENKAAGIKASNNGHVTMGSVNVSNTKANLIQVDTTNTVTGSVTAKDNSSATLGTVNIH